jgi:two-component system sensor histidine kinase VicK
LQKSNKDLKRAQRKIRKSYKELKSLDVEKDKFISVAAHELKTPLTVIGGYSQLLKDDKIGIKKRKRFLTILGDESKRLSQLVSEMLDLSRIDLDAVRYNVERVDIYKFMKNIEHEFVPKIREKRLKYQFNLKKNLPRIEIDRNKLQQILTNVLSNSIKYTLKGKVIVEVIKKGKNIEFSVTDTGIGIDKKYHKKIFERFFNIETPALKEVDSTGLGLSIVKEYVENLGGKIWLKSELRKGSTFYIKLPIKTKLKSDNERVRFLYEKNKVNRKTYKKK